MNTLECIKTRHSTRKFKADQLSENLLIKSSTLVVVLHLAVIHN